MSINISKCQTFQAAVTPLHSHKRSKPSRTANITKSVQEADRQEGKRVTWAESARKGMAAAVVASTLVVSQPAYAMFNVGDAITDPQDALAAVVATRKALESLSREITEMGADCPAPTYTCDMSQLLKKASGRVSGPLNRTLPTLIEELEADPYASDDVLQAVTQAEAILKSNNARIKVDWTGPVEMLGLANASLAEVLDGIEPEKVQVAEERVAACDETVDPRLDGKLECRLVRAVYAKSLAPGIQ
uniref:Uncharacterized protein n=1 Tax=Pyramimonas obovata TaxID=1411642 RepID=A0A7S0R6R2_9CHLO|eukprot:CAMPEP_0118958194 /NCGR_PEP_ID=MMETSP1169-20130426/62500_1 /TAXON_ID=36882 /ORGANISM="Pyramimonas obovata, Strain CCMP722" /LENGTH=246 /DNA_ID=CAMNT_0006906309 /DNA_START=56 /DNA_END=796 /DNA_ORIENTATION=+